MYPVGEHAQDLFDRGWEDPREDMIPHKYPAMQYCDEQTGRCTHCRAIGTLRAYGGIVFCTKCTKRQDTGKRHGMDGLTFAFRFFDDDCPLAYVWCDGAYTRVKGVQRSGSELQFTVSESDVVAGGALTLIRMGLLNQAEPEKTYSAVCQRVPEAVCPHCERTTVLQTGTGDRFCFGCYKHADGNLYAVDMFTYWFHAEKIPYDTYVSVQGKLVRFDNIGLSNSELFDFNLTLLSGKTIVDFHHGIVYLIER